MSETEYTRVSNFEIVDKWGSFTTLEERRFYLKRLVRFESDNMIRNSEIIPGGYDLHTSNLFSVNENSIDTLVRYQLDVLDEVWALPPNIRFQSEAWQILQAAMIPMSREFKIHLQPREDFVPVVVSRLVELIMSDSFLQQNIIAFKCKVIFQSREPEYNRAIIIIYLSLLEKRKMARQMCALVLRKLKDGLAEYEAYSNGKLPIINFPVTDLMSFIQIGTDTKFRLYKILGEKRFNQLFPVEFHQALLMDEKPEYFLGQDP